MSPIITRKKTRFDIVWNPNKASIYDISLDRLDDNLNPLQALKIKAVQIGQSFSVGDRVIGQVSKATGKVYEVMARAIGIGNVVGVFQNSEKLIVNKTFIARARNTLFDAPAIKMQTATSYGYGYGGGTGLDFFNVINSENNPMGYGVGSFESDFTGTYGYGFGFEGYALSHNFSFLKLSPSTNYALVGTIKDTNGNTLESVNENIKTFANIKILNIGAVVSTKTTLSTTFNTNVPTTLKILDFKTKKTLFEDKTLKTSHSFSITGLMSNTVYRFEINVFNANGGDFIGPLLRARTKPDRNENFPLPDIMKYIKNAVEALENKNENIFNFMRGANGWLDLLNNNDLSTWIPATTSLTVEQKRAFENIILNFCLRGSRPLQLINQITIFMQFDNLDVYNKTIALLTKRQKKAMLLAAKQSADAVLREMSFVSIREEIVSMNVAGLVGVQSDTRVFYDAITTPDLPAPGSFNLDDPTQVKA